MAATAAAAAAASKWRNGVFALPPSCRRRGRLSGWLAHGWLYICVYEHCAPEQERERRREWGARSGG